MHEVSSHLLNKPLKWQKEKPRGETFKNDGDEWIKRLMDEAEKMSADEGVENAD